MSKCYLKHKYFEFDLKAETLLKLIFIVCQFSLIIGIGSGRLGSNLNTTGCLLR